MRTRIYAAVLAAVMSLGLVCGLVAPAQARGGGESTWRGLTYGLGGVTAYGAVKRSPTIALLGAAGTAYSYSRWRKAVRDRHRREGWSRRHHYRRHHR
jgi:hypothetical protein